MKFGLGTLLLVAVALVMGFFIALMNYLGALRPVQMEEANTQTLRLLYKQHMGPYHQINGVIQEVESWARSQQIACSRTFGEFLDNPHQVEQARLRANAGCIIDAPVTSVPDGFLYRELSAQNAVVAHFSGSPAIGPWKVYPQAFKYIRQHRLIYAGENFEIYKIISPKKMETTYMFLLKQQGPGSRIQDPGLRPQDSGPDSIQKNAN